MVKVGVVLAGGCEVEVLKLLLLLLLLLFTAVEFSLGGSSPHTTVVTNKNKYT